MELAKELIEEVLRDRTKQFSSEENSKFGSVLADADRLLTKGASVSVHLLMGHSDCKATAREICDATQTLEVWTFKMQREVPYEMTVRPPILPLFLRQAIRSQLHFSPFRSWLTAQKNTEPSADGFCPLLRVSAASDFVAPPISSHQLQSHQFPPCLVRPSLPVVNASLRILQHHNSGEPFWLRVNVRWLKKEYFLTKAPLCPETRVEPQDGLWVLPPADRCHSRVSCAAIEQHTAEAEEEDGILLSDEENGDDSQCLTPTETVSPNVRRKTTELKEGDRRNGIKVREERRGVVDVTQENVKMTERNNAMGEGPKSGGRAQRATKQKQNEGEMNDEVPLDSRHSSNVLATTSNSAFSLCDQTVLSPNIMPILRQNKRNLPLLDRLQLSNGLGCFVGESQEARKCIPRLQTPPSSSMGKSDLPYNKKNWRTSSRLVCNFEESILNGRIQASSVVSGFHLQLTIISNGTSSNNYSPFPASRRLTRPVLTYFFSDLMTQIPGRFPTAVPPSPLHLAHCELGAETIPIPKRCTLQIVLLRPCGSVVKLFLVDVDVLDMPSSSRTFIRQRIFNAKKTGEKDAGSTNKTGGSLANVPNAKSCSNSLRFLIHLRLASDASEQVYLHNDIRILFSNKANDLEGLEPIIEKSNSVCRSVVFEETNLLSMAQMPQTPKYSPIK